MPTPILNAKAKLDGELEFTQALARISAGMKVLNAESKQVSETFKGQESSTEALAAKSDVLVRQIYSQQEKVDVLEQKWKALANRFGESSIEAMNAAADFRNADAALTKMQRTLLKNKNTMEAAGAATDDYTDALKDFKGQVTKTDESVEAVSEKTTGLGDAIGDAANKLGINLPDGAQKALNSLSGLSAGSAMAIGAFAAVAAAIVKVEQALISMTKESAADAKELVNLSQTMGMSTEAAQEWDWILRSVGSSLEDAQGDLSAFQEKILEASKGEGEAAEMFARLGVNVMDANGSLRDADSVLTDTVKALQSMTDETERNAISSILLSTTGEKLIPIYNQQADALDRMAQEAHSMGAVLDQEAVTALTKVDDAMLKFQATTDATKNQLAGEFAPYLEDATVRLTGFVSSFGQALKDSGVVDAFGMLLETFVDLVAPADKLSEETVPKLTEALFPLARLLAAIADVADVVGGLFKLSTSVILTDRWKEGWSDVIGGLGWNYSYGNGNNVQTLYEQQDQRATNAATEAAGYGRYYANGKWYGDYSDYLYEKWEAAGTPGSFDYWKMANGYLRNAMGSDYYRGGATMLSENGPEVAVLPQGTRIYTAQESRMLGAGGTGGDVYNITIPAKDIHEFNDIIRIVQNQKRMSRMGVK